MRLNKKNIEYIWQIMYNKEKYEVRNMKWTNEQSKAIFEKDNNILVAAAAR